MAVLSDMALETTVSGGSVDGEFYLKADAEVDKLRKEIWSTIYGYEGELPMADIALPLGIVQ